VVKKHFVTVFSETTDHSLFIFGIQHWQVVPYLCIWFKVCCSSSSCLLT
jgi:hypothetical protein